ncbi:hypothetical protein LARV_00232 [Longilinea arvoryzae]|uniref:Uncharacterized protein n=1 Tax=Longilinea arvoryzae TaxID=360412 RepID=A0A0S7BFF3_9CHLR|nr:hypothetical protein [Longilinea arvoryzae]GAP12497.1 hypothetical protein LARV_00232 [Longilinea arvoryzae]
MIFAEVPTELTLLAIIAIALLLVWFWKRPGSGFLALCGFSILLMVVSIAIEDAHPDLRPFPGWQGFLILCGTFFLAPSLAIACAARLFSLPAGPRRTAINVFIAILLLALVGVKMFFASLWDVALDGLSGPFLKILVGVAAVLSALAMLIGAPGWRKALALIILATLPLMNVSIELASHAPNGGWGRMPGILTERSAAVIDKAILRYHDRTGGYPAELSDLRPRELLIMPHQYILQSWEWCYTGDQQGYRFGYIYRDFFGRPQSPKIVAEVGSPPEQDWYCPIDAGSIAPAARN